MQYVKYETEYRFYRTFLPQLKMTRSQPRENEENENLWFSIEVASLFNLELVLIWRTCSDLVSDATSIQNKSSYFYAADNHIFFQCVLGSVAKRDSCS